VDPVTLTTPRLTLSTPTADDVDAIFDACQDAEIQRYTLVPSPYRRADAVGFVERCAIRWADGVELTWAIREGSVLVGVLGVHDIANGNASIGYWMAPAGRGRGLLTEAASTVVDWVFAGPLALTRLEWRAVVGNHGSARVAQRLGFRFEGTLRQEFVRSDARHDGWIASLLCTDDRGPQTWDLPD
jgi:RimJ/RimL family protein N-acetyltransferase